MTIATTNHSFIIFSGIIFCFLFMIWTKSNWFNFLIKSTFFIAFVVALVLTLKNYSVF